MCIHTALPVLPVLSVQCPLYIYRYSSECPIGSTGTLHRDSRLRGSHPSFYRWGSAALHPPRSTLALAAAPRIRSHAALDWDGTPTRHRATIRSIPWPDEVGHDPRVCVHPTLLPPKKISCHLIWLSSTSSVVNLK